MAGIFQSGVFSCGFDMDPSGTDILNYATGGAANSFTPYGFGYSWRLDSANHNAGILLNANLTQLYFGAAVYTAQMPATNGGIFFFNDATANSTQVSLFVSGTGQLQFYRGNGVTPIGPASSAGVINVNQWTYLEAFVLISSTVGQVIARVNNSVVITTTATLNTQNSANTWVNAPGFLNFAVGSPNACYFDDWYMLDGTGASPLSTFLGKVQCRGEAPNANSANGARNAWTPTNPQNSNYKNVGNIPYNAAQYDSDSNVSDYDMFRFPGLPGSFSSVFFVNEWMRLGVDSAGVRTVAPNVTSGGVDSLGTAVTPPAGSQLFNQVYTQDPNTSAAWAVAAAGSAELGVQLAS